MAKGVAVVTFAGAGCIGGALVVAGVANWLEDSIKARSKRKRERAEQAALKKKEKALWEVSNLEKYKDYRNLIREELTREIEQKLRREMTLKQRRIENRQKNTPKQELQPAATLTKPVTAEVKTQTEKYKEQRIVAESNAVAEANLPVDVLKEKKLKGTGASTAEANLPIDVLKEKKQCGTGASTAEANIPIDVLKEEKQGGTGPIDVLKEKKQSGTGASTAEANSPIDVLKEEKQRGTGASTITKDVNVTKAFLRAIFVDF